MLISFKNTKIDSTYIEINKASWNIRTEQHFNSEFYDVAGFLAGKNSLKSIELNLLGDVSGLKILHLQCHFGQDSLSLARMGAQVTGLDLSDLSIEKARELNKKLGLDVTFVCCDVMCIMRSNSLTRNLTSFLPRTEQLAGCLILIAGHR